MNDERMDTHAAVDTAEPVTAEAVTEPEPVADEAVGTVPAEGLSDVGDTVSGPCPPSADASFSANGGLRDEIPEVSAAEPVAETVPDSVGQSAAEPTAETVTATEGSAHMEDGFPDVTALSAEIAALRERLDRAENERARIAGEIAEFRTLYPDVSPDALPGAVWEEFARGIPLAASYARSERARKRLEEIAEENAARCRAEASPAAGRAPHRGFYSPDEVRAMSGTEIRAHYAEVLDSMKHWNG